jgi:hypothetical protein
MPGFSGPPGIPGPTGDPGPPGPPGSSAAFKQVNVPGFGITAAPASAGSITVTAPSNGTVLVTGSGFCVTNGQFALALELGPQISEENPQIGTSFQNQSWVSVPEGEAVAPLNAYRSIALSRAFPVSEAGAFAGFLNEQRVSAAPGAAASCFVTLTAFFTADTLP